MVQKMEGEVFTTTDMGLAVFLAWKGCEEAVPPWEVQTGRHGQPEMKFRFQSVDPAILQSYRKDEDGIQKYNTLRQLYLKIIHSEM